MKAALKRNAAATAFQVVTTGLCYFFLYKYLLNTLGVELLGLWSLVLATVSTARISELGFGSSVVKFVAKSLAHNQISNAQKIIETSFITVLCFIVVACLLAYIPISELIEHLVPKKLGAEAKKILPYALASLCINTSANIYLSALDGFQRIDLRQKMLVFSTFIHLLLVYIFVPKFGFLGLAFAQISQNILIFFLSILLIKKFIAIRVFAKWDRASFNEIWRYALTFQLTSVFVLSYEPVTKGLLSYFGGIQTVGYYEMANRLILQIRALIVSVNRIFVPTVAELTETTPKRIPELYRKSYDLFFILVVLIFLYLGINLAPIAELWIGNKESHFIVFSWILILGWAVNSVVGSAFFFNQGTGNLKPNLNTQLTIAIFNAFFLFYIGVLFRLIRSGCRMVTSLNFREYSFTF